MKTVKITLFLAIVACLSGLSIGLVNSFTSPIIEQNAIAAEKQNLELIFPNGNFTAVDYIDDDGVITGVYKVADKGFVFKATAKGYNASNPIVTLIGMDTEGVIVNVVALEEQETKGVGTKCFEEENVQNLYIGKTLDQQVDGITGATFTSEAMKIMIGKAQEAFREVK